VCVCGDCKRIVFVFSRNVYTSKMLCKCWLDIALPLTWECVCLVRALCVMFVPVGQGCRSIVDTVLCLCQYRGPPAVPVDIGCIIVVRRV